MKKMLWVIKKGKRYADNEFIKDSFTSLNKALLYESKADAEASAHFDGGERVVKVQVTRIVEEVK